MPAHEGLHAEARALTVSLDKKMLRYNDIAAVAERYEAEGASAWSGPRGAMARLQAEAQLLAQQHQIEVETAMLDGGQNGA